MHRPRRPSRDRPGILEETSLARAKRTDRTEARRRYRAEQAADAAAVLDDGDDGTTTDAAARPAKGAAPAPATPPVKRPSFTTAFKGAFRPVDYKADIRSLPRIVTHWGFLVSIATAIVATALFIASTNAFAASLDLSLSDPTAGRTVDTVSNISYIVVSLFVVPPPAAGAFLVGFTAARASWLGGLLFGIVAAACYSVILLSPTGRLLIGDAAPEGFIAQAWVTAPLGAAFFAAASAWYKRFLALANPNRARAQQQKPAQKGRGNARPNSRATGRP
jgi:hypothetical protein